VTTVQLIAALGGGAAAGALLTALTTVFTGWLGRRHEHRRWLLDRRLEAYTAMNTALGHWMKQFTHWKLGEELTQLTKAMQDLADKQQAVRLLATPRTGRAAHDVLAVATAAYITTVRAAQQQQELSDEVSDAVMVEFGADGQELFEAQLSDVQGPAAAAKVMATIGHLDLAG
jgi:hypothetical protein